MAATKKQFKQIKSEQELYLASDLYSKDEVDAKITSAVHYKGSVATYAELEAIQNPENGDMYNVTATGKNYIWNETDDEWDDITGIVDLSDYYTAAQVDATFATQATLSSHTGDTTAHITSAERTAWNAKQGAITADGILKGNGSGTISAAVAGTDYVAPSAMSSKVSVSGDTMTGSLVINTGATDGQLKILNSDAPNNPYAALQYNKIVIGNDAGSYNVSFPSQSGTIALLSDIPDAAPVWSVNGSTGDVVLDAADVSALPSSSDITLSGYSLKIMGNGRTYNDEATYYGNRFVLSNGSSSGQSYTIYFPDKPTNSPSGTIALVADVNAVASDIQKISGDVYSSASGLGVVYDRTSELSGAIYHSSSGVSGKVDSLSGAIYGGSTGISAVMSDLSAIVYDNSSGNAALYSAVTGTDSIVHNEISGNGALYNDISAVSGTVYDSTSGNSALYNDISAVSGIVYDLTSGNSALYNDIDTLSGTVYDSTSGNEALYNKITGVSGVVYDSTSGNGALYTAINNVDDKFKDMSITDGTGVTTIQLQQGLSTTVLTAHQDISGKANKSEMSVVAGTGADADKTTITLKTGTSATVLTAHQDISGKVDKSSVTTYLTTDSSTGVLKAFPTTNYSLEDLVAHYNNLLTALTNMVNNIKGVS